MSNRTPQVHKRRVCDELRPLLLHACDEFGLDKVIEVAGKSPTAQEEGRWYSNYENARSGLREYLRQHENFRWSTLKAYDWALRHLYPYAVPAPAQEEIASYVLQPVKTSSKTSPATLRAAARGLDEIAPSPAIGKAAAAAVDRGSASPAIFEAIATASRPDPTDVALDLLAAGDWRALARLSIDQLGGR